MMHVKNSHWKLIILLFLKTENLKSCPAPNPAPLLYWVVIQGRIQDFGRGGGAGNC